MFAAKRIVVAVLVSLLLGCIVIPKQKEKLDPTRSPTTKISLSEEMLKRFMGVDLKAVSICLSENIMYRDSGALAKLRADAKETRTSNFRKNFPPIKPSSELAEIGYIALAELKAVMLENRFRISERSPCLSVRLEIAYLYEKDVFSREAMYIGVSVFEGNTLLAQTRDDWEAGRNLGVARTPIILLPPAEKRGLLREGSVLAVQDMLDVWKMTFTKKAP